jgi:hypothetical protein
MEENKIPYLTQNINALSEHFKQQKTALLNRESQVLISVSCSLTKHHCMKAYWGSADVAPCILDLGTRWS